LVTIGLLAFTVFNGTFFVCKIFGWQNLLQKQRWARSAFTSLPLQAMLDS
jgi:hypothetical protein